VASFLVVCRWETLFPRQRGGRTIEAFDEKFFNLWAWNIPTIEDYPYAGSTSPKIWTCPYLPEI
jgi:hypothetical protein